MTVRAAREAFLGAFSWSAGHADVWAAFEDPYVLSAVVDGIAAPWLDAGVTKVLGIESRGFLLGGAVAVRLGAGFHAIRKGDGMLAGASVSTQESVLDYRGRSHSFRSRDTLTTSDRVLLVDDWAERGAQSAAARALVERAGATWLGVSLIVDQLEASTRRRLGTVTSIVTYAELGRPDAG
jgi:adenine/guanine phosphoribosyltransferase-like PRPP-binding protein